MNPTRSQLINEVRGLMHEASTRSDPSFLGDAIDRMVRAYNIPYELMQFFADANDAKRIMYEGQDATAELKVAHVWLNRLQNMEPCTINKEGV